MTIEKCSAAVSAFVLGAAVFTIVLGLNIPQHYSDFIVGNIAWSAGNKLQDLVVWPTTILFIFLGFIALSRVIQGYRDSNGVILSSRLASHLILWSIPFYIGVGSLFLGGKLENTSIAISVLGITFIGLVSFLSKKNGSIIDPDLPSFTCFSVILIGLMPIEILLLLGRVSMILAEKYSAKAFIKTSYLLVGLGFIVAAFYTIKNKEYLHNHLQKFIFLAQIGLPLFFLTLYPARLLQPTGELIKYDTTIYLKVLVISLIIFSLYDVIHRFRRYHKASDYKKLLSPFAIFGLLIALKSGNTIAPNISPDDYHFGESLLGFWNYLRGALPYIDYIPARGLVEDDLRLLLSFIFYDGSAATVAEAGRLALAMLAFFSFMSIYFFSGSLALAFTVGVLLGGRLSGCFLIPFICLWLSPMLRGKPNKWLAAWIVTSPIVILGAAPQGLPLVVSSSFLAGKLLWEQLFISNKNTWIYIVAASGFVSFLFVVTPLLSMLLGAIQYVLENGPINQIAYGIPWRCSWAPGPNSGFMFEAIRMSWVAIPLVCLWVIYKNWREVGNAQSRFYPAVFFLVFSILLIPYSMGRVDPGVMSRSGFFSIFSWTALFPILVWGLFKENTRVITILCIAFMSALLGFEKISFTRLASAAYAKVPTAPLRDMTSVGLTNIGMASVEDVHWDRITRLDAFLKSRLAADEPYLDLTSRNAHYFYVNRAPMLSVTAPYNLVSPAQQKRAVAALSNPPKVAILQADNIIHDGGGVALRNPYLYRFIIDHYVPRFEKGFIVGYKRSGNENGPETTIIAEVKNSTEANWKGGYNLNDAAIILSDAVLVSMLRIGDQVRLWGRETRKIERICVNGNTLWLAGGPIFFSGDKYPDQVEIITHPKIVLEYTASLFHRSFSVSDFQKIPVSWGRSEKSLSKKMILVKSLDEIVPTLHQLVPHGKEYQVMGANPQLRYDISGLELSGQDVGLLRFNFQCIEKRAESRLQLFWWGDEREGPFASSSVRFTAENGTLIVPLDASPWWLGLKKIKGISIELDAANGCGALSIEKIGLYRRSF